MMRQGTFWAYNLRPPESERERQGNVNCNNIDYPGIGTISQEFKSTMINILNALGEKMHNVHEHMGTINLEN